MKMQTVEVFCELMKKGWIDRSGTPDIWRAYDDPDVMEELETMKDGLDFDIIRSGDRIYLVPTQNNDLFLKNNIDYRKDISANDEVKRRDLYLMNYLSIYLIYLFYHGESNDPKCRDFISKEDFIQEFSLHCKACISGAESEQTDYSDNFLQLAHAWLSKTDGAPDTKKFSERYGMLNRLLIKYDREHDDLFSTDSGNIRPTRKLDDLMPYFLRKDRIADIQRWISEVNEDAADHKA